MKTQITKQHTNVVAVQPLTTFHKEDRMSNACPIHVESQSTAPQTTVSRGISVHRLSTMFAVAISILLLGFICSAQQTATYIPQYTSGLSTINSIMSQPSASQIDVNNGNFNLTNIANAFKIGGNVVLAVGDNPNGTRNLSVGVGAGGADATGGNSNTVVGPSAGHSNGPNSSFNVFVGGAAGSSNISGGYSTCVGVGACAYSNATGNTMLGVFAGFFTTGGFNTFLGQNAGNNNTTGDSNVYIGNIGPTTQENNTIRIGTNGSGIGTGKQNSTYIAGIVSHTVPNAANVYISPSGQLEVGASGITGTCPSGKFATWAGSNTLGCVNNLSDNGTTLTVTGNTSATGTVQSNVGFKVGASPGISVTAFVTDSTGSGVCAMQFTGGILTATTC